MSDQLDIAERIERMVATVERKPGQIGVYSTGEQIAVALVLNNPKLLPQGYSHILEAVERLGEDWLRASIAVTRARRYR